MPIGINPITNDATNTSVGKVRDAVIPNKNDYETNKNRRILIQGITQAVLSSPGVAGLGYTNAAELVALFERVAEKMIAFVDKKIQE